MKSSKILSKVFVSGVLLLGAGFSSCEDFLTVLPTDKITEDDFWKNSSDLNNVRSAAYKQMTSEAVTGRILYWGELRSDNLAQNDMTKTNIELLRKGVLHPTDGMFDWAAFYTGINYCNKVLEKGELMTVPGKEVDPSFRRGDWLPIKAEMLSVRALYYFYLVRAYRNVPFVTSSVSTDAEAMRSKIGATKGVDILGTLIEELDSAKEYAAFDYSSAVERKGRFTKRSVRALLADLQLWRGCMLKNALAKGDTIVVVKDNVKDTLSQAEIDEISKQHFVDAIANCDYIFEDLQREWDEAVLENPALGRYEEGQSEDYPYMGYIRAYGQKGITDNVYKDVLGDRNSDYESLFELQYDGSVLVNSAYKTYLSEYSDGVLKPTAMVGAAEMTGSVESNYNPERGFGKGDIRLVETFKYSSAESQRSPFIKNIATSVTIPDLLNVADQDNKFDLSYRESGSSNANWPVYRLTDIMLIKAEAIARSVDPAATGSNNELLVEGFNLVNSIFKRCNPGMKPTGTAGAGDAVSDRLKPASEYAAERKASDLLTLLYNERQREFIGEGKRWFDIVRQVEATNDSENTLNSYINLSKEVKNRLRNIYAMYVPIYSEELKVNGVEYGGKLVQNPVWDRYTVK